LLGAPAFGARQTLLRLALPRSASAPRESAMAFDKKIVDKRLALSWFRARMTHPSWLWAAFTLTAAGGQTLRNALQHDLTDRVGSAAATFVRFLFGFPFSLVFLLFACVLTASPPPWPNGSAAILAAFASLAQVAATALMLAAMRERSFLVATTLTKTEAVQIVGFNLLFMGDRATGPIIVAVALATLGALILSLPPAAAISGNDRAANRRAAAYGLASAAAFGVATIFFREGILALGGPSYVLAAATELAFALSLQTIAILAYLFLFDRVALRAIACEWRPSLSAGFAGAFATLFWFLAFALETAARVRTLGLVEVVFAQMITRRVFRQRTTPIEWIGTAMIVVGVVIALNAG
jgi:drug/metabolite transporter (DMT)-like permease